MRSVSRVGRVAALSAVIVAVAIVAFLLFRGGAESYTVTARFLNAAQLVKGNLVQIGGTKAGSIKKIEITPDGQAEITMAIDDPSAPLRRGTTAIIRQASQSGIANRYIDLQLPEGDSQEKIPDGGRIGVDETTTAVELDQLFNTFDPVTRFSVQRFFQGQAAQFRGRGPEANRGFQYLNPALSTSRRIFTELNRDTPVLERFLVDSARFVTALAERRDDLADLVHNLNLTTGALAREKVALAESIARLPDFMRRANTTFLNLRTALDDVDPLVDASKPVAPRLRALLAELRPFARDARPTVRDLNIVVRSPGRDNDLIDLGRTFPPLAQIALDPRRRNGAVRRGAFPEMTQALEDTAPIIAHGRPYTQDLIGWFDDFSHTGIYDAIGGISRSHGYFNAFSPSFGILPLGERGANFAQTARTGQFRRCPGASEEPADDRSNVLSAEEQAQLDCRESDRPTGPFGG